MKRYLSQVAAFGSSTFATTVIVWLSLVSQSKAAIDPTAYPEKVKLSVAEVLTLPGQNRLAVAQTRQAEIIKPLEDMIFNREADFGLRWKAVILFGQLQKVKAMKTLDKALKSSEWFIRNAALIAYSEAIPEKAVAIATESLKDKALVVRSAAIDVLERNLQGETREALWNELDSSHNFRKKQSLWIRPQILKALSNVPEQRELPLFVSYLKDSDSRMHAHAVRGLERITNEIKGKTGITIGEKRDIWLKWAANARSTSQF